MATISENQALLDDVWQKIPPEEKHHVLTEAQTTGISTALILVTFGAAIAIGLKQPWYFWGSFGVVPFLFQVASAKAWHIGKPRAIVLYTAARATAVYYAQQAKGEELIPSLQFKGVLSRELSEEELGKEDSFMQEGLEERRAPVPVWVTLFPDSFVMFSETPLGSRKEFACSIFDDISIGSEGFEEDSGEQRKLTISLRNEAGTEQRWTLASQHTGNIVACERKLQSAIEKRNFALEQAAHSKKAAIEQEIQAALAG
jgi:hypothetical protein